MQDGAFVAPADQLPGAKPVAIERGGVDPIPLGMVMAANTEFAMITPPAGLNQLVTGGIANMELAAVSKACAPWIQVDDPVLAADHLRAGRYDVAAQRTDATPGVQAAASPSALGSAAAHRRAPAAGESGRRIAAITAR